MTESTCNYCGASIYLTPFGFHYKWTTDKKDKWKCGNDPAFPVRTHAPKEEFAS